MVVEAANASNCVKVVAIQLNRPYIQRQIPNKLKQQQSSGSPLVAGQAGSIQCSRQSNSAQRHYNLSNRLNILTFRVKSASFSDRRKASMRLRKTRIGWQTISTKSSARRTSLRRRTTLKSPSPMMLSPKSRSAFFAASARPSSCNGTPSQRNSSENSSTPQAQWET